MKKYENLKKGTKNRQKNHSAVKRGITTFLIAVCFIMMVPFDASASEISITTMTDSDDNCTAVYVGSDVSTDGTTLIARCADIISKEHGLNIYNSDQVVWVYDSVHSNDIKFMNVHGVCLCEIRKV